jgi:hypothetical protein
MSGFDCSDLIDLTGMYFMTMIPQDSFFMESIEM